MRICGYFGKRPVERDFVFEGLPARVTDAWANVMGAWMAAAQAAAPKTWQAEFYTAPVWRFAVAANHLNDRAWIGLMAASADEMGRPFPLAILMSMHVENFGKQIIFQIDEFMDRLELDLLDFLAGETQRKDFLSRVTVSAADIHATLDNLRHEVPASFPDLAEGESGLCMPWADLIAPNEQAGQILVWEQSAQMRHPPAPGYWWHEGSAQRVAEYCVFAGMPAASAAVGMFLGNWQSFGWRLRD